MAVKLFTYHDWHLFGDLEGVRMVFIDLKAQQQAEMAIEKSSKTKCLLNLAWTMMQMEDESPDKQV